jgi:hypothetical protein
LIIPLEKSLLLFLAALALAALLLLGQELADRLEPVPLALDEAGSLVHRHFLFDFLLLVCLAVVLFLLQLGAPLIVIRDLLPRALVLLVSFLPLERYFLLFFFNLGLLLFGLHLAALGQFLDFGLAVLDEVRDRVVDQLLGLYLLLKVLNFLSQLELRLLVLSVLAGLVTQDFALEELELQL